MKAKTKKWELHEVGETWAHNDNHAQGKYIQRYQDLPDLRSLRSFILENCVIVITELF